MMSLILSGARIRLDGPANEGHAAMARPGFHWLTPCCGKVMLPPAASCCCFPTGSPCAAGPIARLTARTPHMLPGQTLERSEWLAEMREALEEQDGGWALARQSPPSSRPHRGGVHRQRNASLV